MLHKKPREIAAEVLGRPAGEALFVEKALDRELAKAGMTAADRALCQQLVYGVVRWQRTLDRLIERKTTGRPPPPQLANLLRLGLYQLFWLDRVPDHAAVNETVALAKNTGGGRGAGFLNAVLRGYTREREETRKYLEGLKKAEPGAGYSHPDWVVERWMERWGPEKTARLLEWNNQTPPMFARRNSLKINSADLTKTWTGEGITFKPLSFDWVKDGTVFEIETGRSLTECESFQRGLFYVQDPSTLLAVGMMGATRGERILDVCAAPGGKTTYIAQLIANGGEVTAFDDSPGRLRLLQENCARLGASCVKVATALVAEGEWDRILVDAPCSNTGVMRRRLELRWRLKAEEIERLSQRQSRLLAEAAGRLKRGGVLVYSTCSLEKEENEEVVRKFLLERTGFVVEAERFLTPLEEGVDGAYVARLRRE